MLGNEGKPIARTHNFNLTGLLRCEKCGCAITATKKTKHYKGTDRTVTYTYYHCSKKNKKVKCDAKPIPRDDMYKQIYSLLLSVHPDQAFITWAKKWISVIHEYESSNQECILDSQQEELYRIEKRLNKLLDLRLNDLLTDDAYTTKKNELEKERDLLKGKLDDTESGLSGWRTKVENTLDFAQACHAKFKNGTREQKHEVLLRLGSNLLLGSYRNLAVTLKGEYGVLADQKNWKRRYETWLEPQECTDIMLHNPSLRPPIPFWLAPWDDFRSERFLSAMNHFDFSKSDFMSIVND